mgnify:FL=1
MSDSISRLGIVVEEKGLREALQGLDKLIMLMEKAESRASSPIAVKVDSSNVEASAAKVLKSNTDIANSEKSVASATQQAQTIVVEAKNKGADAAVSSAESSSKKEVSIAENLKEKLVKVAESSASKKELISARTLEKTVAIAKTIAEAENKINIERSKSDSAVAVIRAKSEATAIKASSERSLIQIAYDKQIELNKEASAQIIAGIQAKSDASLAALNAKKIAENEKADKRALLSAQKVQEDVIKVVASSAAKQVATIAESTVNIKREHEKRLTDSERTANRVTITEAKAAASIVQTNARSSAQIQAIRERTASFAERMSLREQAASERTLKAQQQGVESLSSLAAKASAVMSIGFAGWGIQESVMGFIRAADSMTELNARLRLVTSSSRELSAVQQSLFDMSQKSGTSIKANSEIYFGLARAGKTLGTTQQDLIRLTDGLSKASIVGGSSAESYRSAMIQLRQGLESGVLRGQELNSVMEQAPRVAQALAEGLGKTNGELRKMGADGGLVTEVTIPALLKGFKKIDEEFKSMPNTFGRGWQRIENSFLSLVDKINKTSGVTSALSESLTSLSSVMDSFSAEGIATSLEYVAVAGDALAFVLAGKVASATLGFITGQYSAIVANAAKANSDLESARTSTIVAEQNILAARSAQERAAIVVASAERELIAANTGITSAERIIVAQEAAALATRNLVASKSALVIAEEAATVAANAHTVAQERQTAAATRAGIVMGGLKTVFSALGGWITVAIGAIYLLVKAWDSVANAATNAITAQKAAAAGASSATTVVEARRMASKATKDIAFLSTQVETFEAASTNKESTESARRYYAEQARISKEALENAKLAKEAAVNREKQILEQQRNSNKEAEDAIPSPSKVVEKFKNNSLVQTSAMNDASEKEKINQARKQAIASIRASVPPDEKHFRYSETPEVKKAEAEVNKLADAKIAELNEKGKKSGAKTKTKRPELSAGYDAIVSSGKEELELLGKLSSAQEKLLGYVVPETLSRKQAVEVSQEQFNIQSKMAKIQEQLKKDNLGSGVRESLQKTLEMYKKRTDFVSEELAVTHALQKEQNNIKIYQEDILKPAQRRNDIEKELLSYYVQTGELSSAEANRQTLINSKKMIEMEYAGNIAQAQETFNSLQSAGYEEAAKNAQKRLSSLESEREAKLKIAQIKLDGEEDAKKFEAGFGRAWQKFKDDANDASKTAEKLMSGVLKSTEDALYNMMSGVRVSFSDLWKNILSDFRRYLAQQMTKDIGDGLKGILDSVSKPSGGGNGTGNGTSSGTGGGTSMTALGTLGTLGKGAYDWFTGGAKIAASEAASEVARELGGTAASEAASEVASELGSEVAKKAAGETVGTTIGTYATYAKLAFDVFKSIETGKGWGSSAGGVAGAVVGSIVPGLGTALGSVIGSTLGSFLDSAFGGGGGENVGGNFVTSWDANGKVIYQEHGAGFTNNQNDKEIQTTLDGMQTVYADLVKTLGGTAKAIDFSLGYRTDPEGTSGNTIRSQVNVNGIENAYSTYHSIGGDIATEMKLEASKMMVAALKGSGLKKDVEDIFSSIDITTATQAQLDALIEQAKTATQVAEKATEDAKNTEIEMSKIFSLFKSWSSVFPQFEKASADAKKAFVDLSGGLDTLASKMSSYYGNFYSSEEKTANVWSNITSVLSNAGVKEIPKTRAEFRNLMDTTDITTESGRKLANALLSIESQFASVTESLDDVAKAAEDATKETESATKAADDKKAADRATAIRDAQTAVDNARSKVQEAYDREAGALRTTIDRLKQFQDQISKFRDSLYLDNTLSPLSNYDKYQVAKSRFEEIQQKALEGDEKAQSELEQASKDFLDYSRVYNANNAQYKQDFDMVQTVLSKVKDSTNKQIDIATKQLADLDKMVDGILIVNSSVETLTQTISSYFTALIALQAANAGTDAPPVKVPPPVVPPTTKPPVTPITPTTPTTPIGNGSTESVVNSIAFAELTGLINNAASIVYHRGATESEVDWVVKNLGSNASWDSIMSAALAARDSGLSAHDAFVGRINAVSNVFQQRNATSSEIDWITGRVGEGASFTDIKNAAAAGLGITLTTPSHANGLASVPFDGYMAELHQGERVLTKNEATQYNGGVNNWSSSVVEPLLVELSTLREEVKALRQEVSNQGDADRQQRGVIAEAQISVQKKQVVEASRAHANNM